MMMGTADAIPEAPKEAPKFLEDLPESQQARQRAISPSDRSLHCCLNPGF